jgi:type I restriction enzyme, S subunit
MSMLDLRSIPLPDAWQLAPLAQLGRIVTGRTPPRGDDRYFGGETLFVTPRDMHGQRMIEHTDRQLSSEGCERSRRILVPRGSVVVSCIGSQLGKVAVVSGPAVTNQQINTLIPSPRLVPLFAHYVLSTQRRHLKSITGGSAQPIVNKASFARLEIPLPPITEQRRIAAVLGALDDKIEHNHRALRNLDELARALFESRLIGSARGDGQHPKGWSLAPLDAIASFQNGATCQRYPARAGAPWLPVIKIRELTQGVSETSGRADAELASKWRVRDGDVLFSWSGSLSVKLWAGGDGVLNQHLFKVTSDRYPRWFYLHWLYAHLDAFKRIAASKATTTGHIKRHHLRDALCWVPPGPVLEQHGRVLAPLVERQVVNELESRALCELRDALLPKLVSGALRVRTDAALDALIEL